MPSNFRRAGVEELRWRHRSAVDAVVRAQAWADKIEARISLLLASANTPSNEAAQCASATASVATPSIDAADIEGQSNG